DALPLCDLPADFGQRPAERRQALARVDDAVARYLLARYLEHRDQVAADVLVGLDHLREAARLPDHQLVGQQDRERFVADDPARAPDRVAEAERNLLAHGDQVAGLEARRLERRHVLAPAAQRVLEFVGDVEILDQRGLAAPGHENHLLDPRLARLVDRVLDQRAVDDRQQLLGNGLGCREEARAEPGYREHGLADRFAAAHRPLPYGAGQAAVNREQRTPAPVGREPSPPRRVARVNKKEGGSMAMLKLAALAALGYVGWKYYEQSRDKSEPAFAPGQAAGDNFAK